MNKILLARYRAILKNSLSTGVYHDLGQIITSVESICNSVLSTTSANSGINQSMEFGSSSTLTPYPFMFGTNQSIEPTASSILSNVPADRLKVSESCSIRIEPVAVLWCQRVLKTANYHGLEGRSTLNSANADNLALKDDEIYLDPNVSMISQWLLEGCGEIIDEHTAVMITQWLIHGYGEIIGAPNAEMISQWLIKGRGEIANDSIATIISQWLLEGCGEIINEYTATMISQWLIGGYGEIANDSTTTMISQEPLLSEAETVFLKHNAILNDPTAIRGGIDDCAGHIVTGDMISQWLLPNGYGEIANDSSAVLSDYLPPYRIGTISEIQHGSAAILSDYAPIGKIGSAEEISLYSKAQVRTDLLKNAANTFAETFSIATLSTIPAWEYPVLNNGMLKITQAHSATKNNYVLEVG